jgi:hypothetical protein
MTVLFNVFKEAAVPLLFYNLDTRLWPTIKSFLIFLNRIPEYPKSEIDDVEIDEECLSILRSI